MAKKISLEMAKEMCDAKRCRRVAVITYVFGNKSFRMCDQHFIQYLNMQGLNSEENIRKVVK
jgi:hypothetical protein